MKSFAEYYKDLLEWENSTEYEKVFEEADKWRILDEQEMNWAYGDDLNTDYYAIRIDKLPEGVSSTQLFDSIRKNFAQFMYDGIELTPNMDFTSSKLWKSSDPTGSIMVFHTKIDDAAVLTTQSSSTSWIFTPVGTAFSWEHPLAGHRQFGMTSNADGTLTFFTRGVDMLWDVEDQIAKDVMSIWDGDFFSVADALWKNVMYNVMNYVDSQGGNAYMTHSFTRRIDWNVINSKDKN